MTDLTTHYESYDDFLNSLEREAPSLEWARRAKYDNWYGPDVKTWQDAMNLARNGWAYGAAQIKASGEFPHSTVTKYQPSIIGPGSFNMGAITQGRPDAWNRRTRVPVHKHCHLFICNAVSGGVSVNELLTKGAWILQIVDALESQGVRCALTVCFTGVNGYSAMPQRITTTINVKHESEPLNLETLAFAIGHPASFRLLGHASWEMMHREGAHGLQGPFEIAPPESDMIMIPGHAYGEDIAAKVKTTLSDQGVTLEFN